MCPERIADRADRVTAWQPRGQRGHRRSHVVLLALSFVVDAPGAADSPEVESQCGIAGGPRDFPGPDDDRVVHVAAVERMGVAEHESTDGGVGDLDQRLQGGAAGYRDDGGFFHTNPDLRGSAGNIQAPAAVTAYEVCFS